MLTPWKRAKARERNAGYREGYAAGLRVAQRFAEPRATSPSGAAIAHGLAELAHTAQLAADVVNGRKS